MITHSWTHDLHGDGEHDSGSPLSGNGIEGLQIAEL